MNVTAIARHSVTRALPRCGWTLMEDDSMAVMRLPYAVGECVAVSVEAECLGADLWRVNLLDEHWCVITSRRPFRHPCEAMTYLENELANLRHRDLGAPWARGLTTIFDTEGE